VGDDCITIKSGRDAQGRHIGRPAENYTITNCTMLHGHGGVVIGSEMSGGVRNIVASNCVFDGTDRGIRIKSTRGRGGVVENVRISNIVMRNIVHEAITVNLSYTNAPPEPVSERTPAFRNIQINGVSGDADQAGTLQGLPETLLDDVGMFDVNLKARQGFVVKDARNVRLVGVRVDTQSGPAIAAFDVQNLILADVGTQVVHAKTATVELSNVVGGFVRGCFAAPGTDVFLRVAGKGTRALMLEGNDWQAARIPVEMAADVPSGAVTPAPGLHPHTD
jgi:polygalacturonase